MMTKVTCSVSLPIQRSAWRPAVLTQSRLPPCALTYPLERPRRQQNKLAAQDPISVALATRLCDYAKSDAELRARSVRTDSSASFARQLTRQRCRWVCRSAVAKPSISIHNMRDARGPSICSVAIAGLQTDPGYAEAIKQRQALLKPRASSSIGRRKCMMIHPAIGF